MDHVAIMNPAWRLIPKIFSGEKSIESRWYQKRYLPWNRISEGDIIYFKDAGKPITLEAEVSNIIQHEGLNSERIAEILQEYGKNLGISDSEMPSFRESLKNKKYCILIFLKNPRKIESFRINKKGYAIGSAWICVDDVRKIRSNLQVAD